MEEVFAWLIFYIRTYSAPASSKTYFYILNIITKSKTYVNLVLVAADYVF